MKRLYFDTETTGFPQAAGSSLTLQPHIVQLAALLMCDDEGELACMSVIIKPNGWTVGEGAANVHGITTEKATKHGISIVSAMSMFTQMIRVSEQVVAHNIAFDVKLLGFEYHRLEKPNYILERENYCTMVKTTDLCRLPQARGGYKWPKLQEAHEYFFKESFNGAHDAMTDVRACQRIHAHLITHQLD